MSRVHVLDTRCAYSFPWFARLDLIVSNPSAYEKVWKTGDALELDFMQIAAEARPTSGRFLAGRRGCAVTRPGEPTVRSFSKTVGSAGLPSEETLRRSGDAWLCSKGNR